MELSEILKPRLDHAASDTPHDPFSRATNSGTASGSRPEESGPGDQAESQMRKALGLLGESQRQRPDTDRADQPLRMGDRFNGGLHRRRFVQDGDIPVTVLRRDQAHEAPAHRGAASPQGPTSSRLQRTEAALAAETAARDKAERSLADIQAVAHDLQTKIGHAELAKNEALDALNREREATAQLRAGAGTLAEQLREASEQAQAAEHRAQTFQDQLAEERHLRKSAEKAHRNAEAAREAAEMLLRSFSEETPASRRPAEPAYRHPVPAEADVAVRRGRQAEPAAVAPEPVKWWLNTKPASKRR